MWTLFALSASLTVAGVVWLAQDQINGLLNKLPLTLGPGSATEMIITLIAFPFIIAFNMLAMPGLFLGGAGILFGLAALCALAGICKWLYRKCRLTDRIPS